MKIVVDAMGGDFAPKVNVETAQSTRCAHVRTWKSSSSARKR